MLDIGEAFRRILLADPAVVSLVGSRVYTWPAPQSTSFPCVAYEVIDEVEEADFDAGSFGLEATIRVYAVGPKGRDNAVSVAVHSATRLAVIGFSGTVSDGASPESTRDIHLIEKIRSRRIFDDRTETHQVVTEYAVSAEAEVP